MVGRYELEMHRMRRRESKVVVDGPSLGEIRSSSGEREVGLTRVIRVFMGTCPSFGLQVLPRPTN